MGTADRDARWPPLGEGSMSIGQKPSIPNKLLAALAPEELAALEPHLVTMELSRGQVLYESRDTIRHAYFPPSCVVSLLAILEDGGSDEVALFGCEGVLGLARSIVTRES